MSTLQNSYNPMNSGTYDFDPAHPIPYVESIDFISERRDGGLDLALIIGAPLEPDEQSLKRLEQKLRNYLGFIERQKSHHAGSFAITVYMNVGSDEQTTQHLMRHKNWLASSNVDLVVKKLNRKQCPAR